MHRQQRRNGYEVAIGDALFKGAVTGTGSYDNYRVTPVGELKLNAGSHRLEVRPGGPIKGALFDFARLPRCLAKALARK